MKRKNPSSNRNQRSTEDRGFTRGHLSLRDRPGSAEQGGLSGWDRFTQGVEPLPDDKPPVDPGTPLTTGNAVREGTGGAVGRHQIRIGIPDGLNRRQADQLRRGNYPIQRRLDLHGRTSAEARTEVGHFLQSAAAKELRCVLVITGQGRDAHGSPRGVLRDSLERWLNRPRTRDLVLASAPARPRDGGGGAFYILLRRKRRQGR